MKIMIDAKTPRWIATETARGIKVAFSANQANGRRATVQFQENIFFENIETVKRFFKGEIEYVERKVQTKRSKVISE